MQTVAEEYANKPLTVKPGDKFHRLLALMFDTCWGDISDEQVKELEQQVESWRWRNADGERV